MTHPIYISTISQFYNDFIPHVQDSTSICLDIETYILPEYKGLITKALDPHSCGISLMSIYTSHQQLFVLDILLLDSPSFRKSLYNFLSTRSQIICHNASFEAKFLKKYFGKLFFNYWCTRVASQLISNATGSKYIKAVSGHSLKDLVRDYLNIHLDGKGTIVLQDWYCRPLSPEQIQYSATDVLYLFSLKDLFERVLYPPLPEPDVYDDDDYWGLDMKEVVDLEMQFISVEAECEYNGLPVDSHLCDLFEHSIKDPKHRVGELYKIGGELCSLTKLSTELPTDLSKGTYRIPTIESEKALNKSSVLIDIINTYIGPASTSEGRVVQRILSLLEGKASSNGLSYYCDEEENKYKELEHLSVCEVVRRYEVASFLVKYKRYLKQSTMSFKKFIHPITQRIHYSFNSLGASTGRCTSSSPNSMNINSRTPVNVTIPKSFIKSLFSSQPCTPAHKL